MRKLSFNTVLMGISVLIVLVILVGTAFVFMLRKARPGADLRRPEPIPIEQAIMEQRALQEAQQKGASDSQEHQGDGTYTNLGQMRIKTLAEHASQTSSLVFIEPWFSYQAESPAFQEELDNKRQKMRSIFNQYFSSQTHQQLKDLGEAEVKAQLLEMMNQELILGSISALYFEDYLFLE